MELTLTSNTVEDLVGAAAEPYLPSHLIAPPVLAKIRQTAAFLPAGITGFFGFECPLGTAEASADFLVCVGAAEGGRDVLARKNPPAEPVWRRVSDFTREWNDTKSPLFEQIHSIWLEFDTLERPLAIPVPSVFFGSHSFQPDSWLSGLALPLLRGAQLSGGVQRQLELCLNALPADAWIFQVGLMLPRHSSLIRLCVRGIAPGAIVGYLQEIGWPGPSEELRVLLEELQTKSSRIDLDLDIENDVRFQIGLECYGDLTKPSEESAFLDYLVSMNLCTGLKRDALLGWRGKSHEKAQPERWPRDLRAVSDFLGGRADSVFLRWLHHVKLVYSPDQPLRAKAYLAARHAWIPREVLKKIWNESLVLEDVQ